jgi:broad specificity phosphatase PhoE
MTIGTIICAALSLDLAHIHRLKLDLASRSTITFTPFGLFSSWVLTTLNDRHYLAADLR